MDKDTYKELCTLIDEYAGGNNWETTLTFREDVDEFTAAVARLIDDSYGWQRITSECPPIGQEVVVADGDWKWIATREDYRQYDGGIQWVEKEEGMFIGDRLTHYLALPTFPGEEESA